MARLQRDGRIGAGRCRSPRRQRRRMRRQVWPPRKAALCLVSAHTGSRLGGCSAAALTQLYTPAPRNTLYTTPV